MIHLPPLSVACDGDRENTNTVTTHLFLLLVVNNVPMGYV